MYFIVDPSRSASCPKPPSIIPIETPNSISTPQVTGLSSLVQSPEPKDCVPHAPFVIQRVCVQTPPLQTAVTKVRPQVPSLAYGPVSATTPLLSYQPAPTPLPSYPPTPKPPPSYPLAPTPLLSYVPAQPPSSSHVPAATPLPSHVPAATPLWLYANGCNSAYLPHQPASPTKRPPKLFFKQTAGVPSTKGEFYLRLAISLMGHLAFKPNS